MPFWAAHSAIGMVACGRVKVERTMNGEASGMVEVAAAMMTCGTFACVDRGAVAKASGVRPNPAVTVTLSLTISSWAMRRVTSATPVSSRTMSWTFLPATMSPFCCM